MRKPSTGIPSVSSASAVDGTSSSDLTPEEAARTARAPWELGGDALLLARDPDDGIDVEPLVEEALTAAVAQGISGQAVTPFVLSFLHERSGGRTLKANRDLVAANAGLAGEVAVAAAALPDRL